MDPKKKSHKMPPRIPPQFQRSRLQDRFVIGRYNKSIADRHSLTGQIQTLQGQMAAESNPDRRRRIHARIQRLQALYQKTKQATLMWDDIYYRGYPPPPPPPPPGGGGGHGGPGAGAAPIPVGGG